MSTSTMAANIVVGAALAGGFSSTIGSAVGGIGQINRAVGDLGTGLAQLGAAWGTLHGIGDAVKGASDLSHQLKQAGVTADLSNEKLAELRLQLRDLAVPDKTNQSVKELLKGYTALVAAGIGSDDARAALYGIGRTATAASADVEDLAKTATVLLGTLKVPPGDLSAELDRLAFAGKQGAFELKDMAKYFPGLGASAKALGLTGSEAVATLGAALQIAKRGAADPSEAANNMKNFLSKATSPDTVKRFKEHGINLKKALKKAVSEGENPMEKLLEIIQKVTKGDQFKMGELFGDMQVLDFLKPMLADMEDYKRLKGDIMTAKGTVDQDFARMMEENKELANGAAIAFNKLSDTVGKALIPAFNAVLKVITPVITGFANAAEKSPALTASMIGLGAAFTLLPPLITAVTIGWAVMSKSMMATPIGAILGVIAFAAGVIIDNWSNIRTAFIGFWDGIKELWADAINGIKGLFDALIHPLTTIKELWDKMPGLTKVSAPNFGIIDADKAKAAKAKEQKAAVPTIGAAVNDNQAVAANDNAIARPPVKGAVRVVPGAGLAAAEAKGAQAMAARTTAAPVQAAAPASAASTAVQRVELVLTLAPGVNATVKAPNPNVSVITRTGPTMSGGN